MLISSVEKTLQMIPKKSTLVIGGGDAELVFKELTKSFSDLNCKMARENIGRVKDDCGIIKNKNRCHVIRNGVCQLSCYF